MGPCLYPEFCLGLLSICKSSSLCQSLTETSVNYCTSFNKYTIRGDRSWHCPKSVALKGFLLGKGLYNGTFWHPGHWMGLSPQFLNCLSKQVAQSLIWHLLTKKLAHQQREWWEGGTLYTRFIPPLRLKDPEEFWLENPIAILLWGFLTFFLYLSQINLLKTQQNLFCMFC